MKKTRKIIGIAFVFAMVAMLACMLAGCKKNKQNYDTETRAFSMSISTPDGVFNPYFSSSAYDSSIVGQTQIGMLSTDSKGNIVAGENEPCVAKDYSVTEAADKTSTTYEFLIKNGIKFSDGHNLTIKDVLFNLYVYLDPAYTGNATIYSTDIVGLKNYRMQQTGETSDSSAFEETFVAKAYARVLDNVDYVKMVGLGIKSEDRPSDRWNDEQKAQLRKDYATVAATFKEELNTDWNNASVESYEDWGFTAKWQVFLMNDGGYSDLLARDASNKLIKDENGNYKLDEAEANRVYNDQIMVGINDEPEKYAGLSDEDKIKKYCIDSVYDSYFPAGGIEKTDCTQFETVIKFWATATTIIDKFTAEAKSDYFSGTNMKVPNISGITTRKTNEFKGAALDAEYDVLTIKINNVDPKAIYNFAFTVSPLHYYSTNNWNGKDYVAAFNGETEFGLEFGSIEFMNNVINSSEKVGLPLGAGPYKASNESGSGTVTASNFFNNNMVYYERNEYFNTVGKELSNAKIKYLRYKVVESDQIINALANKDIDFGDPSATQENIAAVRNAGLGDVEIDTSGYGYVGINPRFVPNITVRRVIMKAMNTALITQNYYKGGLATLITRPMSKTSWAYPSDATAYVDEASGVSYAYDSTGYYIDTMLQAEGYQKNSDGIYYKDIKGYGTDTLTGTNYTMTIAGGSTDHPAYAMFLKAKEILNAHGVDVRVVTSTTALSDLSNGKLAIWAAAWSSTIDPDMYQVYHIDSQASSTSNWGYKQIKAGKNTEAYSQEYGIITELSELIDAGRATTVQSERKEIYAQALDKIMELAVEMPTYQRKDMSAYNKDVIDESTLTPESERSPYNGLLSRIWELNYR